MHPATAYEASSMTSIVCPLALLGSAVTAKILNIITVPGATHLGTSAESTSDDCTLRCGYGHYHRPQKCSVRRARRRKVTSEEQ